MSAVERLDRAGLRAALGVAERWLELNRDAVNAINVYPVPDGDTGTNMLLTLRHALEAADEASGSDAGVGEYAAALARGALLGARGNSGVILSQMLRGFADGLEGHDDLDAASLSAALVTASSAAYEAVGTPVEGTMLTVLREASEHAAEAASREPPLAELLATTVQAARESVERTPTLLPRLREAGVVDAGGEGIAVLLEGLRLGVADEELPPAPEAPIGAIQLDGVSHEGHGFCVEYLVEGDDLDRGALVQTLAAAGGDSVLVVGDPHALHVHVHVPDPEVALATGRAAGSVERVKVEDMQAQHEAWAAGHEDGVEPPPVGLVAVVQGDGLRVAFRDLGVGVIVDAGATQNPSAGELLEAARRAGREHAFILPNDPNVVMAAEQAAEQEPGRISVVPARSIAAGLAAAVVFVPGEPLDVLAERMAEASAEVRSIEVTRAVRDTTADGVTVSEGEPIVFVDGKLVSSAESLEDALLDGLHRAVDGRELISVYLGADAAEEDNVRVLLEAAFPDVEVEVLYGGQRHYPYLAGVE